MALNPSIEIPSGARKSKGLKEKEIKIIDVKSQKWSISEKISTVYKFIYEFHTYVCMQDLKSAL